MDDQKDAINDKKQQLKTRQENQVASNHKPTEMRVVTEKEQEKFRDYVDEKLKDVQRKNVRRLAGEEGGYHDLEQLSKDLIALLAIVKYSVTQTQAEKTVPPSGQSHHLDRLAALKRYKESTSEMSSDGETPEPGTPGDTEMTPASAADMDIDTPQTDTPTLSDLAGQQLCPIDNVDQQQFINFRGRVEPAHVDTSALYGQTFYLLRMADDYNTYLSQYEGSPKMFELLDQLNGIFKTMLTGDLEGVGMTQTEATRLQSIAERTRVMVASKFDETSEEVAHVYEDVIEIIA